jgi:hypothetical protein
VTNGGEEQLTNKTNKPYQDWAVSNIRWTTVSANDCQNLCITIIYCFRPQHLQLLHLSSDRQKTSSTSVGDQYAHSREIWPRCVKPSSWTNSTQCWGSSGHSGGQPLHDSNRDTQLGKCGAFCISLTKQVICGTTTCTSSSIYYYYWHVLYELYTH